ncbi:Protein numb [Oopsacas minuta]|uniref:Protein numb n=1 Tax=Oopsacas minuta TaxID=111878 RepID=A0AAV7J9B7_9METZ|nr:Protein numb [Oopsacas minuta]
MSLFQKKRSEAGKARELEKQESNQWERDKEKVFNSCVSFNVKVLGEISVDEARGVEICEYAVKDIPYKKNKTRGLLKIYAHGLTLVEEKSSALLINQTIEKVSFCCALPSNDRIFTYIARDSFTRQWLCHAFVTTKGLSADRVSHACACAFTACLQKKQRERTKAGLAPLGDTLNPNSTQTGLDMRRVKSSGEILESTNRSKQLTMVAPLKPLGGSRGDLLEESMEVRSEAARRANVKLLLESTEVNGHTKQLYPPELQIPASPKKTARQFETNFTSIERNKQNRRSLPDRSNIPQVIDSSPVDPWAPAYSPIKKPYLDPFDPFSLMNISGNTNQQLGPIMTNSNFNPFSSCPMETSGFDTFPKKNRNNPFL